MVDIFVNVQEDVALGLLGGRKAKTGDDDDEFVRISCCGVAMAAIDEEDMFLCGHQVTGPSSGCCGKCLGAFVRCLDRVPLPTIWFKFIACVILLAVLVAAGVAIVLLTDDDTTTAIDAVYFVVISATTVGYGDRVIDGNTQRVIWSIWLMLVVVLLAKTFDEFTDARVHRHMKDLRAKLKSMELSKVSLFTVTFCANSAHDYILIENPRQHTRSSIALEAGDPRDGLRQRWPRLESRVSPSQNGRSVRL